MSPVFVNKIQSDRVHGHAALIVHYRKESLSVGLCVSAYQKFHIRDRACEVFLLFSDISLSIKLHFFFATENSFGTPQ